MLKSAELLRQARERTGLGDFGDESFREGLDRLVMSLNDEARLTTVGTAGMSGQIVHFLSQRLQVEDWYRRHPEIDDEQITAPLIGLGLPRTGSTVMSFLLGQDPHARSLKSWESTTPCPPPTIETAIPIRASRRRGSHSSAATRPFRA